MIIGYYLSLQDDDSSMLGAETGRATPGSHFYDWRYLENRRPHPATCANCGRKTDPDYISPTFKVRHRSWDAAATYDGYSLASRRFREAADNRHWLGFEFDSLPADPEFFRLRAQTAVEFDAIARGTRFEKPCPVCRGFHDVIGATPVRLKEPQEVSPDRLYRTDICFGSGHEQGPLLIAGPSLGQEIKSLRLRKVTLVPIDIAANGPQHRTVGSK